MHPWAIIVEGFKNYRVNWLKLAGLYLLIYIPLTGLDLLLEYGNINAVAVQLANSLIRWILDAFVMVSLILFVKDQFNVIKSKITEIMKTAMKFLWRYILTTLLYGAITLSIILLAVIIWSILYSSFSKMPNTMVIISVASIAIVACVFAAVYCVIRFSLAGVISVMEEVGPIKALKTSYGLVKNNVTSVVGVFALVILFFSLLAIPGYLLTLVLGTKSALLLTSYQILLGAVSVPIWVAVAVLLYKKLKAENK